MMKKILSIFSISFILSSGGILSGGGIACKSSSTFNLSNIKLGDNIVGLANKKATTNEAASMEINGAETYTKIENDIIIQYQKFFPNSKLTNANFIANSTTPNQTQTWALKITNGSFDVLNQYTSDIGVWYNQPLTSKTNSLSVEITTIDSNVTSNNINKNNTKSDIIPVYFNKYIFTTKDVNNGNEIAVPKEGATLESINLTKTKALDLSAYFNLSNKNISSVLTQWDNLADSKKIKIYNDILNQINAKFDTYMAKVSSVSKIKPFANASDVKKNKILSSKFLAFDANSIGKISTYNDNAGVFSTNSEIFVAIPVFNWKYLENNNYFSNSDTYVYAYLGTTEAFNLKTITLNSNDIAELQSVPKTASEPATMKINGKETYTNIEKDIINQYNSFVQKYPLVTGAFIANSTTPTIKTPWALKITNGDVDVSNTDSSDLQIWYNKGLASKTNSLSVTITTIDLNVGVTKSKTINVYFNKYIFTTQDANNNDGINVPNIGATTSSINLQQNKVLDLSSYNLIKNPSIESVHEAIYYLSDTKKATIYNKILDQINANFDTYMVNIKKIKKVAHFTYSSIEHNTISSSTFSYFGVQSNNSIVMHDDYGEGYQPGEKAYMAIPVSSWYYLTSANYFSNSDTYVYAYLGTVPTS